MCQQGGEAKRLGDVIVGARFEAEDGVRIGAVAREHDDRRLEAVPAQDAHGFAAVAGDVSKSGVVLTKLLLARQILAVSLQN
jgi:hypothetical protein